MPAIQTIYTGNKKTDEYLSNIYQILNEHESVLGKKSLNSDLIETNKILEATAHARLHALDSTDDHSIGSLTANYLVKSNGTKLVPSTNTDAEIAAAVAASHTRLHALDSTSDHSIGSLTSGYLTKSDGTKLVPSTNTDAQVAAAVAASHTRQHAIDSTSDHTGTITQNYLMKANASGLPAISQIFDNGTNVGIGTAIPGSKVDIFGTNATLRFTRDDGLRFGSIFYDGGTFVIKQPLNDSIDIQSSAGASLLTILPTGNVGIGFATPTAKLDILAKQSDSTSDLVLFRQTLLAHGITDIMPTNACGLIQTVFHDYDGTDYPRGGLRIKGIGFYDACTSDVEPGITLEGYLGIADPPDTDRAIKIIGGKKSGTGVTALAAAETVLELFNYTTSLLTITGDGDLTMKIGDLNINNGYALHFDTTNTPAGSCTQKIKFEDEANPSELIGYIGYQTGSGQSITFSFANDLMAYITNTGGLWCNAGMTVNDGGGDYDTRIEGDGDVNLFFCDAGNDRVGIGRNDPVSKLHVSGIITVGALDDDCYRMYSATNNAYRWALSNSSTGIFSIIQEGDGWASEGTRFSINRSGVINYPNCPISAAGLSAGDIWCDTSLGGGNILKMVT